MKEIRVNTAITVYENMEEMPPDEVKIMKRAIEMLDSAYAPYSEFYVGAAALTSSGNIHGGCNQENASYPLCVCGERVALFNAGANEPKSAIKMLAIVAHNPAKSIELPVSPCGACRQVIAEFEMRHNSSFPVLLKADSEVVYKFKTGSDLLPFSFDNTYL